VLRSRSAPLSVRARRALARPAVRRIVVGVVALATGLAVVSLVRSAEAARLRWGDTRPVAVATHDLAVGDPLGGDAAEVRRLPTALVPPGALSAPPVGALVRQPIAAGEALVAERLAPHGLTGAAALVPPGSRAVAVPLAPVPAPPLAVGDLVDLLAVVSPASGGVGIVDSEGVDGEDGGGGGGVDRGGGVHRSAEPAFPLVETAPVVDVGDETVSVAVPEADAPRVAYALAQGAVVVTLAGAP
jgi:SAF domain-containing protein